MIQKMFLVFVLFILLFSYSPVSSKNTVIVIYNKDHLSLRINSDTFLDDKIFVIHAKRSFNIDIQIFEMDIIILNVLNNKNDIILEREQGRYGEEKIIVYNNYGIPRILIMPFWRFVVNV